MNTEGPTLGRLVVIAGFALTCFGLLLFLWLAFGGPIPLKPQGYRVQVAFTDAPTLADQADVRTAGVRIGRVVKKQLAPEGNKTLATIELDSKYAPMKADARAILRQKTLLGETYVEVTTGSPGAPDIKEGARLRDGQVAQAVEFDELFSIFDKKTRKTFQQWMASAAQAGAGRGRDLSDALGNLPVFVENAQGVVDVLGERRAALRDLVKNTGRTFEELTADEGALTELTVRNTELFDELSRRREHLADSIRIFPTFLTETKLTLARLKTFSVNTEPLIRDLEPVLDDLQPTLVSLRRLSPDLENLFDNVNPLITAGDKGPREPLRQRQPAHHRRRQGVAGAVADPQRPRPDARVDGAVPAAAQPAPALPRVPPDVALELSEHRPQRARRHPLGTRGQQQQRPRAAADHHVRLGVAARADAHAHEPRQRVPGPGLPARPGDAHLPELRLRELRREGPDQHAGLQGAGRAAVRGQGAALPERRAGPQRRPAAVQRPLRPRGMCA